MGFLHPIKDNVPKSNVEKSPFLQIKLLEDTVTTAGHHPAELTRIVLNTAGLTCFSVSRIFSVSTEKSACIAFKTLLPQVSDSVTAG